MHYGQAYNIKTAATNETPVPSPGLSVAWMQTSVRECRRSAGLWAWRFECAELLTFIDGQWRSSGSSTRTTLELATHLAAAARRTFSSYMCHLCQ